MPPFIMLALFNFSIGSIELIIIPLYQQSVKSYGVDLVVAIMEEDMEEVIEEIMTDVNKIKTNPF